MPLNIRIQWNAGTACVSECVLKTLWRVGVCVSVGPSKRRPEIAAISGTLSGVIRANRKFEWFMRIGLTRYKNRGFNCEWFTRIDSRESRCESPVPLSRHTFKQRSTWRVPNPPGANPLVAERAFLTSDYWGRTGVARCAEEMTGICRDFQ